MGLLPVKLEDRIHTHAVTEHRDGGLDAELIENDTEVAREIFDGEASQIFGSLRVTMPAIVKPDGLIVFSEVIDLISPVKARANQAVTENQRLAGPFNAVEEARAVETFYVAMGCRRALARLRG